MLARASRQHAPRRSKSREIISTGRAGCGLLQAMEPYREAAGRYPPSYELDEAVRIIIDSELLDRISGQEAARLYMKRDMVRGALQIAAPRLLGQNMQEQAGDTELLKSLYALGQDPGGEAESVR